MQELSNIYNSVSEESLDSLFENYVVITEKLSGSSFSFQVKEDRVVFYKGNKEIDLVDRTLINYYEDAISFIKNISENLNSASSNLRFCFQYFVNNKPGIIHYDNLPKNKLVLTHILEMSNTNKVLSIKNDYNSLYKWSNKLNVSFIEPIYEGYMTLGQKKYLKEYLSVSYDDRERLNMFEKSSFASSIFTVFNPDSNCSFLQSDLSKPIDGIVFSFLSERNEQVKTKLLDPYTVQSIKKRKTNYKKYKADINEVLLVDILSFINERGLLLNQLISSEKDKRYIELVSKIFNDYVDVKKNIERIYIDEAKFARGPEFDLNTDFVKNKQTKENLNKSKTHKSLFKIMLGSLRKKRNLKKGSNVMTDSVITEFNNLIEEIENGINEKPAEFKTFLDFISHKNESLTQPSVEELILEENILKIDEFLNLGKIKM